MSNEKFSSLGLSEKILEAVANAGYEKPSPIQTKAIPEVLSGRDIFGCAQTGTGKTAAFVLPIIQKIGESGGYPAPKEFRALILTPTRELAEQISVNVALYSKFSKIKQAKVYGGVSEKPQIKSLKDGADILVATPGRLLDLYRQRALSFNSVEFFVLDEADRMLDMGFIHDVRKISALLPKDRQTLLFSATLSDDVRALAADLVKNPVQISVSPDKPTVDKIAQSVCFVETSDKQNLLEYMMKKRLEREPEALALVFSRTKHGANKIAKKLIASGINAGVIHGNKSQSARTRALESFKNRESHILVATDIAARGIDVKDMSLVINFDLPEEAETYVHRIGRTARAEAEGEAVSFCAPTEAALFSDIQKLIKAYIPENPDNPFFSESAKVAAESRNPSAAARRAKSERFNRIARERGDVSQARDSHRNRQHRNFRNDAGSGLRRPSGKPESESRGNKFGKKYSNKTHKSGIPNATRARGHFGVSKPKGSGARKGFWKSVAEKFAGKKGK